MSRVQSKMIDAVSLKRTEVLFVWVPKVAGSSIYAMLEPYNCPMLKTKRRARQFTNTGFVTSSHMSIFSLLESKVISEEYFSKAFKFCFVRNPWDRLVSLYFYKHYHRVMSFDSFCQLVHKKIALKDTKWGRLCQHIYDVPFVEYAVSLIDKVPGYSSSPIDRVPGISYLPLPLPKLSAQLAMPNLGMYHTRGLTQANPQLDWISDAEGRIVVDFVGRFENLQGDCQRVCDIIGIECTLPHFNKTKRSRNYREYYSSRTKRIVRETYGRDIEAFGYEF